MVGPPSCEVKKKCLGYDRSLNVKVVPVVKGKAADIHAGTYDYLPALPHKDTVGHGAQEAYPQRPLLVALFCLM